MGNPSQANGARRRHVVRWLRSQGRPCWICGLPIDYGVPAGDPRAFECDELVPVSRGGSPFDRDNVAAAHRCCNNWRRARSVAEVSAVRSALAARRAAWNSPETFVDEKKGRIMSAKPEGIADGILNIFLYRSVNSIV